jgi:cytosine/adenosine deaminase-related metal-dependent hydrolase
VHNPISNLRCGSGLLPVADLLAGDVRLALGADGAASNDNQNMFEAMKFATLIHTLYGPHQRWPRAEQIWEMCLRGGAAALGQDLGSIEPGRVADIVLLDSQRHVAVDKNGLVASLVLAEHGESVHTVIVGGEVMIEEGRSVRVDESEATRRSLALQRRIHERLPGRQAVFDEHADVLTAIHEHAMAAPAPIERLAVITPAFGAE